MKNDSIIMENLHRFYYKEGELYYAVAVGRARVDDVAGWDAGRYRVVAIQWKNLLVHRIIFALHHGYLPELIDHIDRNPYNNRIENLRPATNAVNALNRKLDSRNKSGITGVRRYRQKWRAQINIDGKLVHLGTYNTPEEAEQVYLKERDKIMSRYY
jgi:hypothetical protein